MAWNKEQAVNRAVKSASNSESKFLSQMKTQDIGKHHFQAEKVAMVNKCQEVTLIGNKYSNDDVYATNALMGSESPVANGIISAL